MPDGLKRLHRSGQSHFITFSCYQRRPLLRQMSLQDDFLVALEQMRIQFAMRVYGYIVMPEHVHLLLSEPEDDQMGKAMQVLKMRVSLAARRKGARVAGGYPLWQSRYFDHNVRNHAGFVTQLRYIHRNPVKRGLCGAPEDWPWSSFLAWAKGEIRIVEVESEMRAALREQQLKRIPESRNE